MYYLRPWSVKNKSNYFLASDCLVLAHVPSGLASHSGKGAHLKKTSGLLQNEKGKAEIQFREETRVHNIAKQTK